MERFFPLFLVMVYTGCGVGQQSVANECRGDLCPTGTFCVSEPKQCVTTSCDQFICVPLQERDACASLPCPRGQHCINEPKQCFTQPCDQFRCEPSDPCQTMRCSSGFHCVSSNNCSNRGCQLVGQCVSNQAEEIGSQVKSCPPTDGVNCVAGRCTRLGCPSGTMCCPNGCGGSSCQEPL